MTDGPSQHLSWLRDLSCWNRLEPARPYHGIEPGQLVAVYPLDKRQTEAVKIAAFFEAIRGGCSDYVGEDCPIYINSAYRPPEYDREAGGVSNWHVKAGAIDMWTPAKFKVRGYTVVSFHALVVLLEKQGQLPTLGGLGLYDWGLHADDRPRLADGSITQWDFRAATLAKAAKRAG